MNTTHTVFETAFTWTCIQCGNSWPRREAFARSDESGICPDCARREAKQRLSLSQSVGDATGWEKLCPELYRKTDSTRLPQDKFRDVMSWQYGPEGLLLIGATGKGKTRAAWLLLRRLYDEGRMIRAFDCASFGHEASQRFRDGTGETWADALAKVPVLFFDDLGKWPMTERAEAEYFAIVERRTARQLPIICTSNMTGSDLAAKASADRGEPLIRRLREFCRAIIF